MSARVVHQVEIEFAKLQKLSKESVPTITAEAERIRNNRAIREAYVKEKFDLAHTLVPYLLNSPNLSPQQMACLQAKGKFYDEISQLIDITSYEPLSERVKQKVELRLAKLEKLVAETRQNNTSSSNFSSDEGFISHIDTINYLGKRGNTVDDAVAYLNQNRVSPASYEKIITALNQGNPFEPSPDLFKRDLIQRLENDAREAGYA